MVMSMPTRVALSLLTTVVLLIVGTALQGCWPEEPPLREAGDFGSAQFRDVSTVADLAFERTVAPLESPAPRDTLSMLRSFGGEDDFGHITMVTLLGDRLLVSDRYSSPHLAVISRTTGEIMRRFGRDGKGPREFRDPVGAFVAPGQSSLVWVYDFYNRRFTLLDLDKDGNDVVRREMPLNVNASLEHPVWSGNRILANGLFADFTLLEIDSAGRPLSRISAGPPFTKQVPPQGLRRANRSFLTMDPSGKRIAVTYQFASRLDFFRADGTRYGTVNGPRPTKISFDVDDRGRMNWEKDNVMTSWSMTSTDRHVYVLFCGCEMREGGESPTRVHVYDWEGNFIHELALDRPIRAAAVTADDGWLYGAVEEPYPVVGEWRLPDELQNVKAGSR